MWKCPTCSEAVEDQFETCWKCGRPKPANVQQVENTPSSGADPFQENKQPDGTVKVAVLGRELRCTVCANDTFRERSSLLNTAMMTFFKLDWANKAAANFICARCGYIFWFLPK